MLVRVICLRNCWNDTLKLKFRIKVGGSTFQYKKLYISLILVFQDKL